ncbi:MAG: F0F1 ATP synthase subunit delta [Syntrophomonadaceae bacterium]
MLNKSVARRYAEALFSLAQESEKIDEFQVEMEKVVSALAEVPEFKGYLEHLLIPAKDKKEVIKQIFADQISQTTLNFVFILIDKRREGYLEVILDEYKAMADESKNITKADLISAKEIPSDEIQALAGKLSASTGKTVQLSQVVDESLIGGVKLRIGDRVIDATVAKRLEMLKEQLKKIKIS